MRLNTQSAALCLLLALSSCAQNGIRDRDGDGYTVAVDCDDGDESVGAPRPELCNGIDDDCDGAVDEDAFGKTAYWADADGDGFGAAGEMSVGCIVPTGSALFGGDCDDHDAAVHPDAVERCNELAAKFGDRFLPPALLVEMAENGETFYGRFGTEVAEAA